MTQLTEFRPNELQAQTTDVDLLLQQQQGGVDVWGILSRRKWLLVLGLILGLGLGYIYLLQADPVYESAAQILIENKKPPAIPIAGGIDTTFTTVSEEQKHVIVIMSPSILQAAYDDFDLEKLSTFAAEGDTGLSKLGENLTVDLVAEGTNVLNVSYRGPNPDDAQSVVNAVINAYRKFLEDTYRDTGQETRDLIVKAKDELLAKIQALNEEYREFKRTTPLMWNGDAAINIHAERQAAYESERVNLEKQIADLKAKARALQEAIDRGDTPESILLLAELDGDKTATKQADAHLKDQYLRLLFEVETLLQRYGPDHPDVLILRNNMAKFAELYPQIVDESASQASDDQLLTHVTSYLGALQQKQSQLQYQYQNLDQKFAEEEEASKVLQNAQFEDERLREELDRTQQLFEVVVKSLEEISLVKDYEGYNYQILAMPSIGEKVAPLPMKIMAVSGMLGMLAGFGIAYLVDMADKSFRTPDEVSQVMRLPVVGHIPLIDTNKQSVVPSSKVSPVVVTVHRPKSPQAESYRAVRTALYFNNRDQLHQVIQVTSPMPGDGKTTLSSNLAVTIAQSGKRVLLMDADFRRPSVHRTFGLDKLDVGLASVVSGDREPRDAMQTLLEVPNLSLMPCGPRPGNPSELLSSEQFEDLLEVLRQQFDFVIVDTPPVLAVSDPCAVAARVDGVIMTFRIHKRARPLATRARDALNSMGAHLIGVVVNGVDQETGGYYSQYRYGYAGYRYGTNSRYGYGYGTYGSEGSETKAIKKYFDDDTQPSHFQASATIDSASTHQS